MNEKKHRLFEISERLEAISNQMKTNSPGLVAVLVLALYAREIEELTQEMNYLLGEVKYLE